MDKVPLILSVETATLAGSVSLARGNEVLATIMGDTQVSHSNTLLLEIDKVLNHAGYSLADIDLYAVATGPGSFTGLRIGIATVKGLAFTLKRPCVGVPTLYAVAHSAGVCERVVAVLPAGRGEVFAQMFEVSLDDVAPLDNPVHIAPNSMLEKYSQFSAICWCGEGAYIHRDRIKDWADENQGELIESSTDGRSSSGWRIIPNTKRLAEQVATLAFRRAKEKQFQSPEALTAIYVRPSDAELNAKPAR